MNFYKVAVNTPFNRSVLTYSSERDIEVGTLVMVPLGKRSCLGCIIALESAADVEAVKLKEILPEDSPYGFGFSGHELSFISWISDYYHYPLGQLISDVLPKAMKRPRPLKIVRGAQQSINLTLTDEQNTAMNKLRNRGEGFQRFLVHGVTGSGKSLIYLMLMKEIFEKRKSVLFLLPEINLTPQFIQTFSESIDVPVFVYNSSISASEKYGLWTHLSQSNEACLIIGVRSSVFLPIGSLGLIIVDEEHDSSFKQEDRCPYNARDVAIKKAQLYDCLVVLGSATPSMETYQQLKSTPNYITLKKRAISAVLPKITLLNCRQVGTSSPESDWPFHPQALEALGQSLLKKEQALVFLNKLGYADFLQCRSCGHHFSCPNCSSNLKYYKSRKEISCQICGLKDKAPEICPACGNMAIKQVGFGTEKLTEILEAKFPNARIERFDRDEITTFSQLTEKLESFHRGDIDIFVGTQMLSKGHNFKRVNLVLVMGIDAQLNFPDYKSNERAYQLITQISGRPGRFGDDSEVLIHTLNEDNPLFKIIQNHEFDSFYNEEEKLRELCECPPFARLAMIYVTAKSREIAMKESIMIGQFFNDMQEKQLTKLKVLGPRPSIIEKRVNKYTWSLMLRSEDRNQLHNALKTLVKYQKLQSGVTFKIDVDPYHLH